MTTEIISAPPVGGAFHARESTEVPPAPEALLDDPDAAPEQRAFAVPVAEHGLRIDKVLVSEA